MGQDTAVELPRIMSVVADVRTWVFFSLAPTRCSQLASEYDSKYEKTLGKLEQRVRDNLDWIGVKQDGRLLDYACGTGLLSRVAILLPQKGGEGRLSFALGVWSWRLKLLRGRPWRPGSASPLG